jgi:hypothetical protein
MRSIALVLGLSIAACGPSAAEQAHDRAVRAQLRHYVFHKPLPVVWAEARALLGEHGFGVVDEQLGPESTLRTSWMPFTHHRERFLVTGVARGDDACQITFTRVRVPNNYPYPENPPSDHQHRDFQLEWDLVQRVDPGAIH